MKLLLRSVRPFLVVSPFFPNSERSMVPPDKEPFHLDAHTSLNPTPILESTPLPRNASDSSTYPLDPLLDAPGGVRRCSSVYLPLPAVIFWRSARTFGKNSPYLAAPISALCGSSPRGRTLFGNSV